ncbi:MAG: ATP-binding cassette domain-containing protein [Actinocrinis sp.]
MIEAIDLTVRRRGGTLLDAVSFDVRPGQVTGVLGGTGAGKTMLVRRMVQLERGGGETLFDGRPYRSLPHPMREVGLLLDAGAGHPDRTVRGQLLLALATDRRAAREAAVINGPGLGRPDGRKSTANAAAGRADGVAAGIGAGNGARGVATVSVGAASGARGGFHGSTGADADAGAGFGASTRTDVSDVDEVGFDDLCGSGASGDAGGRRGWADRFRPGRTAKADADRDVAPSVHIDLEPGRKCRPADRIEAVLDIVGLTEQSRTRLSDLTDGMATRLGIAVALLGDPKALVLDSPERGLEPEGVAWLGALLRAFTAQGRAALVTGADTETLVGMVDRLLLLDHGYLAGARTAEEVLRAPSGAAVVVRSPQIVRLASILTEAGARTTQGDGTSLEVRGLDRARVGDLAFRNNVPVHELSEQFTGSDPGDLVLAACSGRNRPIVPIQGFPDTTPNAASSTAPNGMRPRASRRAREGELVRITMSPGEDLFEGVRLLTPVGEKAAAGGTEAAGSALRTVAGEHSDPDAHTTGRKDAVVSQGLGGATTGTTTTGTTTITGSNVRVIADGADAADAAEDPGTDAAELGDGAGPGVDPDANADAGEDLAPQPGQDDSSSAARQAEPPNQAAPKTAREAALEAAPETAPNTAPETAPEPAQQESQRVEGDK